MWPTWALMCSTFRPSIPSGSSHRKGRNNSPVCEPGDPGSPWAIGAAEGGHTAIHPELGTLDDFRNFVRRARSLGLDVAMDLAFQCSPDHPYVREHPEWFRLRPDGSIQYAENPPKKYQDIYPLHFECAERRALMDELKRVVLFWIEQGIHIFRVDNPHTKPFAFWEWLIAEVKRSHPEVIFLAEAFTRPKVMYRLAKLGFSQSYYVFRLAEYGLGDPEIFHRTHANGRGRVLSAQPLAEYAGHSDGTPPDRRAAGVHRTA